jgi:hypothetical protein
MVPHDTTDGDMLARFLDSLPVPFEWMDLLNVHEPPSRIIAVRCDDHEMLDNAMRTIPDRNVVRAFGFSYPEGSEVWNSTES